MLQITEAFITALVAILKYSLWAQQMIIFRQNMVLFICKIYYLDFDKFFHYIACHGQLPRIAIIWLIEITDQIAHKSFAKPYKTFDMSICVDAIESSQKVELVNPIILFDVLE